MRLGRNGVALVACLGLSALPGCGGGGGNNAGAPGGPPVRVQMQVEWPARTRAAAGSLASPESAESVVINLVGARTDGGDVTISLQRPQNDGGGLSSATTLANAKPGTWTLTAVFYARQTYDGDVVGAAGLTVRLGADGKLFKQDGSALGRLEVAAAIRRVTVATGQTFRVGQPRDLDCAGIDANGNIVAVGRNAYQIAVTAGGANIRTDSDNRLVGLAPGRATVQVTVDHVASAPADVNVVIDAPIVVSPAYADINVGDTVQFTATSGSGGPLNVQWSVQEGPAGGTIAPDGRYTAPAIPAGTCHVIAVDQADASRRVVVPVRVTSTTICFTGQDPFVRSLGGMAATNTGMTPQMGQQLKGMAKDSAGRIYVVDAALGRVMRVDDAAGGNPVQFGSDGSGAGQLHGPTGIAIDATDRIYIADAGNNRIVRMDDVTGRNWVTFGTLGSGEGQLSSPTGIAIDRLQRIYVTDANNWRIVRMDDMSGRNWRTVALGSASMATSTPQGICAAPDGRIYATAFGDQPIIRIDDFDRGALTRFGVTGFRAGEFEWATSIDVDTLGRIYVADASLQRLTRMDDMAGGHLVTYDTSKFPGMGVGSPWGILVH